MLEKSSNAVEVGKVCIRLQDPVRKGQEERIQIQSALPRLQERLCLHPSNDVVETQGDVQEKSGRRQIVIVACELHETECTMNHGQHKLGFSSQRALNSQAFFGPLRKMGDIEPLEG